MRIAGIALIACLGVTACGRPEPTAARPANAPAEVANAATTDGEAELGDGQIAQRLRDQHADRLAGLYLDRVRNRILVRLTGATPVASETHTVEGRTLQVVFEPGARNSLAELNEIIAGSAAKIEAALPTAHARYLDERTGEIVIAVDPDDSGGEAKEAELARSLGAPVRIEVEGRAVPQ
ncbi:MAG: hypothetical protein KYX67_07250 [Brevundimonas sp.]|uniref:hypothetical protein n=1 Tax=Brevundimonas sp. TaxID=1871086 RepID=UPI00256BBF48|nr:hypothetical protein [Brevundimonas sp.]MDK2747098.1 hypothetical protein [Brevundimonas sp.]